MTNFKTFAPIEVQKYWSEMPNSVRALYGTFQRTRFPWTIKEIEIEAWGQLCFDEAAQRAVAYHMHNHGMRTGWKFLSWRCVMDSPPVGDRAKLSGIAPEHFDIYGPGNVPSEHRGGRQ